MNPPIRSKEHGDALFQGLLDGSIEAIGTDHSPHTREEKLNDDIWKAISGFTSVETSLAVFLSLAVTTGRMTLEQLVRVASEGPAKCWDLYPQKGSLHATLTGKAETPDCDNYILGGIEPINWAYITHNGQSQAPADPLHTGTFSNPNLDAVTPA